VGRLGGDEFAAILAELAMPSDAGLSRRRSSTSSGSPSIDGKETYVSASIGITLYPATATAPTRWS